MFIHDVVVESVASETCRCMDAASSDEEDAETAAQRRCLLATRSWLLSHVTFCL